MLSGYSPQVLCTEALNFVQVTTKLLNQLQCCSCSIKHKQDQHCVWAVPHTQKYQHYHEIYSHYYKQKIMWVFSFK